MMRTGTPRTGMPRTRRIPQIIVALAALTLEASLGSAHAASTFALIPASGTDSQDLSRALNHPAVRRRAPIFAPAEQRSLIELGETALASSVHVSFANESDFREFSGAITSLGLKLKLEPLELPIALSFADPLEREQWGLNNNGAPLTTAIDDITSTTLPAKAGEDIQVELAPTEKQDASRVIVAVLDTGIDGTHPDLAPRLLQKTEECKALESYRECLKGTDKRACDQKWAAFDSDGNGYPMDCLGWNLTVGKNPLNGIQGNGQTQDTVGHGTHVAGVIGAAANGLGIRGVSQNVSLLPVKIFNGNPRSPVRAQSLSNGSEPLPEPSDNGRTWDTGFADVIARGVLYAIRSGAQVMNISLAWPASADSELMRRMIRLAQARGILIVAAAGNDSTEAEVMPCAYAGVACVASHQPDGSLSHFSNHGASVDLAAPGVRILSTWPLNLRPAVFTDLVGYEFKNGTSMAAPFVTGALARLIASGFSSQEAFARVLAGARPTPTSQSRSVRFGNLDLRASHELIPEPLIVPDQKEMIEVSWDRKSARLIPSFRLKNAWSDAAAVEITARLPSDLEGMLELENPTQVSRNWASGVSRSFSMPLRVMNDGFPSEIDLWLDVRARSSTAPRTQLKARTYKIRIAVSVPILARGMDSEMESIPLLDAALISGENVKIRTVLPTGTSESSRVMRDYAVIKRKSPTERVLTLVSRKFVDGTETGPYTSQGSIPLSATDSELLAIYRLNWDTLTEDEYAILTTISATSGKSAKFRFLFLGRTGNTLERKLELIYEPTKAVIPEDFSWLRVGDRLFPAWVGGGFTPDAEIPAHDPWKPEWTDSPRSRFYYLDSSGLRTIAEPESYTFVSVLGQTQDQKQEGLLPVLLAKGESYRLEYATALIRSASSGSAKPEVIGVKPLRLGSYRMLLGFDTALPVWSVDQGANSAGSAFSLSGRPGTLRTTILEYRKDSTDSRNAAPEISRISDLLSTPVFETDAVVRTAAVFAGTGGGVFTQTQFDLQFQDQEHRSTALTSLRRFSFLPQLSFLRSFIPAVVHARDASESRRPAILIEGSPSGKDISETIFPDYASDGTLLRLAQPARLRLAAGPGCQRIPNPISPTSTAPTQVAFFCEDRFIRVPLTR